MESFQQPAANAELTTDTPSKPDSMLDVGSWRLNVQRALAWIKHFFDYLGASREDPPPGVSFLASAWWPGLWWGLLAALILLFCGQTSKFIYIDF